MKNLLMLGIAAVAISLSACGQPSPTQPRIRAEQQKRALDEDPPQFPAECPEGTISLETDGGKCAPPVIDY